MDDPQGSDLCQEATAGDIVKKDPKNKGKGVAFEAGDVPDDFYTDGKTARLAAQTIADLKKKNQPFFLAVGLSKPHLPFVSPKKYWDLYDPAQIPDTASAFPVSAPAYVGDSDSGEFRAYTNVPPKDKALARTRCRLPSPHRCVTATTPQSAIPTPTSASSSMPSRRKVSPTTR